MEGVLVIKKEQKRTRVHATLTPSPIRRLLLSSVPKEVTMHTQPTRAEEQTRRCTPLVHRRPPPPLITGGIPLPFLLLLPSLTCILVAVLVVLNFPLLVRLKTPVHCPTRRSGRGRGSLRNADSLVVPCGDQAARGTAGFSLLNFGFFPDLVGFDSVAMLGEWSRRTEICSTIKL